MLRHNKLPSRVALLVGALALTACSAGESGEQGSWLHAPTWLAQLLNLDTTPRLDTPKQASLWLAQQAQQAQSNNTTQLTNQAQTTDRRLIRTVGSVPEHVFLSINTTPAANPPTATITPVESLIDNADMEAGFLGVPSVGKDSSGINTPPPAMSVHQNSLSTAAYSQIKYAGLLQYGEERYGIIRLGEQIYRVQVNDKIGRGSWRITALTENHMLLNLNGKVTRYAK